MNLKNEYFLIFETGEYFKLKTLIFDTTKRVRTLNMVVQSQDHLHLFFSPFPPFREIKTYKK